MAEEKKGAFAMIKGAGKDFMADQIPREAAALSYYTIFSLPPLLVLVMSIAGMLWDPQDVQEALRGQLGSVLGQSGGEGISTMMQEAERPRGEGILPTLLGIGGLLFGATGAFMALQGALNRVWEVKPDPAQGGIMNFIIKRFLSLGLIVVIAFLLLVSLALSAALSAFGEVLSARMPGISDIVLHVINFALSFVVITGVFAAMFKVLPDAEVTWSDVWVGAIATALLFVLGKYAIGLYLGQSNPGDAYGAAGSLAVILVWVYYASMIVLFGAEFTQQWANKRGEGIQPEEGAVRVERHEKVKRGPEEQRRASEEARKKGEAPPPKQESTKK